MQNKKELPVQQFEELLRTLNERFNKNMNRHNGLEWPKVQLKLEANTEKLYALSEMERTGGEPDVVEYDSKTNEFIFSDCSAESPIGRRSICYDKQALDSRKEHKPKNSAMGMANDMGIELLSEEQYRAIQALQLDGKKLDMKTSSWLKTPADIRNLGGAVFADFRFGKIFVYHNGAESYYAGRGFRGSLRV